MAGLVPAIPIMSATQCPPKRDARDKRGHDGLLNVIAGLDPAIHADGQLGMDHRVKPGGDEEVVVMAGLVPPAGRSGILLSLV
jgi:hypothetical protein